MDHFGVVLRAKEIYTTTSAHHVTIGEQNKQIATRIEKLL